MRGRRFSAESSLQRFALTRLPIFRRNLIIRDAKRTGTRPPAAIIGRRGATEQRRTAD